MNRPLGVTVLAILAAIAGVFGLFGAFAILGLSGAAGGGFLILGLLTLVLALLALAFAYGAWTLQPWAWTLGVAWAGITIVLSVLAIISGAAVVNELIDIAIAAVVLWYLFTDEVKAAFGRGTAAPPPHRGA